MKNNNFKFGFSVILPALLSRLDIFSERTYCYLINNPLNGIEIIYWVMVFTLIIVMTHLLNISDKLKF